eukprot:g5264.t1
MKKSTPGLPPMGKDSRRKNSSSSSGSNASPSKPRRRRSILNTAASSPKPPPKSSKPKEILKRMSITKRRISSTPARRGSTNAAAGEIGLGAVLKDNISVDTSRASWPRTGSTESIISPWGALRTTMKIRGNLKAKPRVQAAEKVSLTSIFKARSDLENQLRELRYDAEEYNDLVRELRENVRNLRVWHNAFKWLKVPILERLGNDGAVEGGDARSRGRSRSSRYSQNELRTNRGGRDSIVPVLVFFHFYLTSVEMSLVQVLDRVHAVQIVPNIHGKRLEDVQSKLAVRLVRLFHRASRLRQRNHEFLCGLVRSSNSTGDRNDSIDSGGEPRRQASVRRLLKSSVSSQKPISSTVWTTSVRLSFDEDSPLVLLDSPAATAAMAESAENAHISPVRVVKMGKGLLYSVVRIGLVTRVADLLPALRSVVQIEGSLALQLRVVVVAIEDAKSLGMNPWKRRGESRQRDCDDGFRTSEAESTGTQGTVLYCSGDFASFGTSFGGEKEDGDADDDVEQSDSDESSEEETYDDCDERLASELRRFAHVKAVENFDAASRGQWALGVADVINMGSHVRYVLEITTPDKRTTWQVTYRFTTIKHLLRALRMAVSADAVGKIEALPKKGVLRSKMDPDVVEERCDAIRKMLHSSVRCGALFRSEEAVRLICSKRHMERTVSQRAGMEGLRHDLIGWLHKLSPRGVTRLVRGWKRRYFVLLGNDLCYYKSRLEGLRGSINVHSIVRVGFVASVTGPGDASAFEVVTQERVYTLCAQSEAANRRWIEAIARVARLVRTKRGYFTIPGLPLPSTLLVNGGQMRSWHRLSTRVDWVDCERGRGYKSSRDSVILHRLRVSSRHHTWTLTIRTTTFAQFYNAALARRSSAALMADHGGGRDGWQLARRIDTLPIRFALRTFEKFDLKTKRGQFIALYTNEIMQLNVETEGIWNDLLETWLLHGTVPTTVRRGSNEPVGSLAAASNARGVGFGPSHGETDVVDEWGEDEMDIIDDEESADVWGIASSLLDESDQAESKIRGIGDSVRVSNAGKDAHARSARGTKVERDRTTSDEDDDDDSEPTLRVFDSRGILRAMRLKRYQVVSRTPLASDEYVLKALTSWWVRCRVGASNPPSIPPGSGLCAYLECGSE